MELLTISWKTLIGLLSGITLFFLIAKLKKEVAIEKDRLRAIAHAKRGNKRLNNMVYAGKTASQIFKELRAKRKKQSKSKRKT